MEGKKMTVVDVKIKRAGYDKDTIILDNVHFSIKKGEIVGLIGPNGAGKSTTIKSLLSVLNFVEGEVVFPNQEIYSYIPERPIFYDELTLWEHLDLAAGVMSIDEKVFQTRVNHLLTIFRMEKVIHQLPSTFSKGMQQKIMLITALLLKPDIYIIDEPFIGLDPKAMKDFLQLIEEEKARGAGILMSTHVLDTAEKICDRFLLVTEGKLIAEGTLQDLQIQCGDHNASLFDCFHLLSEGVEK